MTSELSHLGQFDYDIRIYSLTQTSANTSIPRSTTPDTPHLPFVLQQCLRSLNKKGEQTTNEALVIARVKFKPLVFSSGGMTSKGTVEELRQWGRRLERRMLRLKERIGLELLRCYGYVMPMHNNTKHQKGYIDYA
ncbi:LOW QUALITY PROTEIN: hypothetical protein L198_03798 [Cryptococcus wingfieldii CBS 7118]|uniref:Uncharacterized protein n=1 Tax=Cryptococcus wingfieldii CBS 7118 TaxID=1295528 RepID=A0A1E3J985_9TREE|nr:LOW QUALITY PROTEIN: hypothetical protein L198_03798 [Cryptococcus wingfieldii CBS 7118]ODN97235.1 LOW QUALITY PROTEIN: hypothetical protein L198_03798 [Cryptococcus wingfieldii CBS 7118]